MIRLYAAYHISHEAVYNLAIVTFVDLLGLYGLKSFVYNTAGARESIFPFLTAGLGLVWMAMRRDHYLF